VENKTCIFLLHNELVGQLILYCIISKQRWKIISSLILNLLGLDGLTQKLYLNSVTYAQGKSCLGLDMAWSKVIAYLGRWKVLYTDAQLETMNEMMLKLEKTRGELPRIAWKTP
jgi:hypothetical protein